jgi:sigma-B regulation protein RsbQ
MSKDKAKSRQVLKKNNVTIIGNRVAEKTMIFVHGFGTDQTSWSKVVSAFSNDYRIVLLDNAGAGKSDHAAFAQSRYQTLEKYADDVLDVCDTLNLEDAILIGHSAGGMIALLSGVRAPEYFSRIVLLGASPRYLNDENYFGGLTNADIRDLYDAIQRNCGEWAIHFSKMAMNNPDKPDLADNFAKTIRDIPTERILTVLHSILQTDYREEVSKLTIPTLIIQSQDDVFVPMQVAEFLHKHIKNSQLAVIHASGHFPHISAPEAVISAISNFMSLRLSQ